MLLVSSGKVCIKRNLRCFALNAMFVYKSFYDDVVALLNPLAFFSTNFVMVKSMEDRAVCVNFLSL